MTDKRRADLAHDTAGELSDCARDGAASAYLNKPEDACPYGWDTAQGIIWLQAWRLTTDRLSD